MNAIEELVIIRTRITQLIGALSEHEKSAPVSSESSVKMLGLNCRAFKCLRGAGIESIDQLCQCSKADLMAIRNFGELSFREVKQKLAARGLSINPSKFRCVQ